MVEQAVKSHRAVEAPSGKGAGDENFPVGSRLIAPHLRPHVMRYYDFARGTDDIADNPDLSAEEKIRRLDLCDAGLQPDAAGPEMATRLRDSLAETGVDVSCASDLLIAFRWDATRLRYDTWEALLEYCRYSASPVGRYLLQLHGEDPSTAAPGDALCAALQVLNHLQDLGDDRRELDRVYLPADWMEEAGIDLAHLDAPVASAGLRAVIDRCLDKTDDLLDRSAPLAGVIRDRRLGAEVAVIHRLARCLAARLRREDPIAGRVKHSKLDLMRGLLAGALRFVGVRR